MSGSEKDKSKKNCWEIKKCGQEKNCPVYRERRLDGINEGYNGGRSCWAIDHTLCHGTTQGTFVDKVSVCRQCVVWQRVVKEQGIKFVPSSMIIRIINTPAKKAG